MLSTTVFNSTALSQIEDRHNAKLYTVKKEKVLKKNRNGLLTDLMMGYCLLPGSY